MWVIVLLARNSKSLLGNLGGVAVAQEKAFFDADAAEWGGCCFGSLLGLAGEHLRESLLFLRRS